MPAVVFTKIASGAVQPAGLYSGQLVWFLPRLGARCVFSSDQGDLSHDVPSSDTAAWRAVVRVLRSPLDSVACALFPASCRICGDSVLRLGRIPVCETCIAPQSAPSSNSCRVCGENFGVESFPGQYLAEPRSCRECEAVPPPFRSAVSHGGYQGTLRALIHLVKYEGVAPAARPLGKLLAYAIGQFDPQLPQDTVVVAVPLHAAKERQRGFNQSECVATEALAEMRRNSGRSLRFERNGLRRGRPTDSQFGLTAHQRRRNLKGAFTVAKPQAIRGKTVLLIDDIYTTGATARECARTLRAAGAAEVYVATLARAQRDGIARWDAVEFATPPITFQSSGSTVTAS